MQITVDRLSPVIQPDSVWVCTTRDLAGEVATQLPEVPGEQILAEPKGRNTAPAIAWAVSEMPQEVQKGVVAVLPADHFITDLQGFRDTLIAAGEIAAAERRIMTLGVQPTRAETGYGYLQVGPDLGEATGLREVVRFTEKPEPDTAQQFFDSGDYLWNAGMFVFPGELLLERVAQLQPEIDRGLAAARREPEKLDTIYGQLPAISIDHAIMERLQDMGTLPLDCGWSDLGSWEALWESLTRDANGNVLQGSTVAIDSTDSLIYADHGTVAVVGVEGLVVVKTEDTVLVIPKERSQEVRRIISALKDSGQTALL